MTKTDLSSAFPLSRLYIRHGAHTTTDTSHKDRHPVEIHDPRTDNHGFPFTERHLQCTWFDSTFRPATLQTFSGESVTVHHPGRWNLEAGPDFLDASLSVGADHRLLRGDVEIHVHPSDWQTHSHQHNPAYQRLVAHVTYFPGTIPEPTLPPNTLQISLRDPLAANRSFSFENIDVASYPYAIRSPSPPCARLLSVWTPGDLVMLLNSAGEERLRLKAERLSMAINERDPDQVLYEEILCTLGYKHNRTPFRLLASRLPLETLRRESRRHALSAYALLLGVSGFMPSTLSATWDHDTRTFVRSLWNHWWKHRAELETLSLPRSFWKLSGLRPPNHPVRRLAAAASWFSNRRSLALRIQALPTRNPDAWFRRATALFSETADLPYWSHRLALGQPIQKTETALVGADRISSILLNVVIPFMAATGQEVKALTAHLPPEQDNALIRQTASSLFGRDHNPALYHQGLRQQGLLQIFHDFCLHTPTDCSDCRLLSSLTS